LVRAFARAAAAERELELVIAGGPGNDSVAVEREISALPEAFRRRVHVVGRIDEADKSWLVHHARVLAYPSLDEGFGFPLLEAMGAGTPVVASTAGSIPEVAGDAAILHEPTDDEALAAALALLHTDDALRDGLVERGRRNVTRYSWRTTASRLIALYDALAMDRPR
jgi:glycosyltransferase involved in cell wall biosynthesis